jgi:hypothetical protein
VTDPHEGARSGAERARLATDGDAWRRWGPYLSERAWGTVREDYSPDGDAWSFFPHDHARSRTYRWNEDGLAGLCDDRQRLCFSLALWNGADPILKERAFGLTGPEGNHGEDVKEYWWFVDSTPTHSWMRWRYAYPQAAYPYDDLVAENARRGRRDPEYELLDTGVFEGDRYFDVTVDYAKAAPDDVCLRIRVTNRGPDAATLHLLPTLWFRDTWSWALGVPEPALHATQEGALLAEHEELGRMVLASDGEATALFCDNATNTARLFGEPGPAYPKDGINDHVIAGAATVNPARTGTKAALHHVVPLAPGAVHEIRLRLSPDPAPDLGDGWLAVLTAREAEADEFYADLTAGATAEEAHVIRSAMAGMLWSKQYYAYRVRTWLTGDPGEPAPPPERWEGRNHRWQNLDAEAVVSMPDPWEYPWFAAWDLAFHCVTLAHVDPAFAKQQLAMVLGAGWMHPTGQVPAYEWDFGAVNPPVHAWAALHVFRRDGGTDLPWLRQVFERLIVNATWWVARNDPEGDGTFSGGFLGMDNIGPFDRNAPLPDGVTLLQADATGWMALACVSMFEIALVLCESDPALEDMALMFFDLFALIARATETSGLWNEEDGFFYDRLVRPDGTGWPVAVRSMCGFIPVFAAVSVRRDLLARLPRLRIHVERFLADHGNAAEAADVDLGARAGDGAPGLLALVDRERLRRIMEVVGAEGEMLSPHGVRAISAAYRDHPFVLHAGVEDDTQVDYEPAESTTDLFGGNSNWRGPVWLPVNYLLQQALRRYGDTAGGDLVCEYPAGSGRSATFHDLAADIADRLVGLYLPDAEGRRAVWGANPRFTTDPAWRDALLFYEYFNGDDGAGLGASHQTGWRG